MKPFHIHQMIMITIQMMRDLLMSRRVIGQPTEGITSSNMMIIIDITNINIMNINITVMMTLIANVMDTDQANITNPTIKEVIPEHMDHIPEEEEEMIITDVDHIVGITINVEVDMEDMVDIGKLSVLK